MPRKKQQTSEEKKAYMRAYNKEHRDNLRAYHKEYYQAHKHEISDINKAIRKKKNADKGIKNQKNDKPFQVIITHYQLSKKNNQHQQIQVQPLQLMEDNFYRDPITSQQLFFSPPKVQTISLGEKELGKARLPTEENEFPFEPEESDSLFDEQWQGFFTL